MAKVGKKEWTKKGPLGTRQVRERRKGGGVFGKGKDGQGGKKGAEQERTPKEPGGDTFKERGGGNNIFKPDKIKLRSL